MTHQKIEIIGYLGADPEMRFTASGQPVTNFSVATNRKYKNASGEDVKETTWFKVSAWGKLAEVCNTYLHKGSQVYIEGRLIADPATGGPRLWTRQDGSPAASFELRANLVLFLGGKNGNVPAPSNGEGNGAPAEAASAEEDQIPF